MIIYKCKLCGGSIEINDGGTVTVCKYCGTKQTLPKLNDEKKANLYDRASHFRRNNDFDKAMAIYEQILAEDKEDAESYWSILLCRYGIEYVDDPLTHETKPTVNRVQYTSIFDDEDYKSALEYADSEQRAIYEKEAREINEIQKHYLEISQKEEPFDVFICYKDMDAQGRRTQDSVLATELYMELTKQGYKVFFSRITLEDKLGIAYEPYIFSALNTAKVMVVLGTKSEHFNSVWVKNEWSRFLALIKKGEKKVLIPAFRDMDPYDLPEEFSHLQAQDMGKIGFLQDLIRGISKLIGDGEAKKEEKVAPVIITSTLNVSPLLKRAEMAMEDNDFEQADSFCEQILNQEPQNAMAYLYKALCFFKLKKVEELGSCGFAIGENGNFKKALKFADKELADALNTYVNINEENREKKRKESEYKRANHLLQLAKSPEMLIIAKDVFESLGGYLDSQELAAKCVTLAKEQRERAEAQRKERARQLALEKERRKAAAKKRLKISIITLICIAVIGALSYGTYFTINYVMVPNKMYDEAMSLADNDKFDEALSMLEEGERSVFFQGQIEKFSSAKLTVEALKKLYIAEKEAQAEADRIAQEKEQAIKDSVSQAIDAIPNGEYEKIAVDLLNGDVDVIISYDGNGGTVNGKIVRKYENADEFDSIATAERFGYEQSWSYKGHSYNGEAKEFTLELKAVWTPITYRIQYDYKGGTMANPTKNYTIESEDFALGIPKKEGYTFLGWRSVESPELEINKVVTKGTTGDLVFYASWQANSYEITFITNDQEIKIEPITVTFDKTYSLPTLKKTGYSFDGWYLKSGGTKLIDGVWKKSESITVVAKWSVITYTVSYDLGDTKYDVTNENPTSYTVQSSFTLKPLTHYGCTFEGWYGDKNFENEITNILPGTTGNITFYAKWTVHKYNVTYDLNEGTYSGELQYEFTVFDLPLELPKPTKEGCTFYYWGAEDKNGDVVPQIDECRDYSLFASYATYGLKVEQYSGYRGVYHYAIYEGDSRVLEIPKYTAKGVLINGIWKIVAPNLEKVKLTNGIVIVDLLLSSNCPLLKELVFEDGLKIIESLAGMEALEKLVIPDSLLDSHADFEGFELEYTTYKNGKYLGNEKNPYVVFVGSVSETMLATELHPDVRSVGKHAFRNNGRVYSLVLPKGLNGVNRFAFQNCYNLLEIYNLAGVELSVTSVLIHTSLDSESIAIKDENGFLFRMYNNGTYKLMGYVGGNKNIVLPSDIRGNSYEIGDYAFSDYGLSSVVIPEGVTAIGANSFANCTGIYKIVIPTTVTKIDATAFTGSTITEVYNLSSVDIKSINGIKNAKCIHTSLDEESCLVESGDYLFHRCVLDNSYTLICYNGSGEEIVLPDNINGYSYAIGTNAFSQADMVRQITLSKGVTQICDQAFYEADGLERVVISESVIMIGRQIFSGCDRIKWVKFEDPEGWVVVKSNGNEEVNAESLLKEETARNYLYNIVYYYLPWIKK